MRKKNNNVKRNQTMAKYILKDLAICQLSNHKCEIIDLKTYLPVKANANDIMTIVNSMQNFQHEWSSSVIVFCRDQKGEEYFRDYVNESVRRCYSSEVQETMRESHDKLISKVNKNHTLCGGWIAKPTGNFEFCQEGLDKLYTSLGAWSKFITKHEHTLN